MRTHLPDNLRVHGGDCEEQRRGLDRERIEQENSGRRQQHRQVVQPCVLLVVRDDHEVDRPQRLLTRGIVRFMHEADGMFVRFRVAQKQGMGE